MPSERLPVPIEAAAYYVVSEAVTNIVKYAGATSITVTVVSDEEHVIVTVIDDGCGGADPTAGTGLRGLRDRVAALDGTLRCRQPDRSRHEDRRRDPARGTSRARPLELSRLASA